MGLLDQEFRDRIVVLRLVWVTLKVESCISLVTCRTGLHKQGTSVLLRDCMLKSC